jgi:hypothetical protein
MSHDSIERRLRAEADREAERFEPRPLPAGVTEAREALAAIRRPSRSAGLAMAVAGLALVGVVGWAAWRSFGPDDGGINPGGGPTAPASASVSPSAQRVLPACGAGDFLIASDPWDAAAGSRGTRIVFRVVDSTPACVLPAFAGAEITDADGTFLVRGTWRTMAAHDVTAGTQLEVGVSWSNWCGAPPADPRLVLLLDTDVVPVDPAGGAGILVPPCNGPGQPTVLNVTEFQPSERPPIGG